MKRFYALGLLVILSMALTPLFVLAQDDKFEEYESEDGLLTLLYPAGWVFEEDLEFLPVFMAGNSAAAAERMNTEEAMIPESGDVLLFVMIMPTDFFNMMGAELDPEASLADLTTEIATLFLSPEDPEAEMPELGEAEEIELGDDLTAGYVEFDEGYDYGAFILRQLGDDLLALTLIGTPPDEFTEEIADLGKQVAASITYTGTGEDIMTALMAAPDIEEAPEGVTAADLDGEALVAERCTVCHTADRIYAADKTEEEWAATVDRMIGYGADLNSAEREAVIAHLASQ